DFRPPQQFLEIVGEMNNGVALGKVTRPPFVVAVQRGDPGAGHVARTGQGGLLAHGCQHLLGRDIACTGDQEADRAGIGAAPRAISAQPTAQPTATFVPTIVPVSGSQFSQVTTPTAVPTSSFDSGQPTEEAPQQSGPPLWLTLSLLGMCCVFLLLIGVVVLGFIARRGNHQQGGGNNG
ncbi:MAG TPA: hypothetical protein PLA27_15950, partial [Anaerolineales bacterium]|nr:hypothetical protein [Anaerolineales bacterium]